MIVYMKKLISKRFIITFDVFEKTAKNRTEAFFLRIFYQFYFLGIADEFFFKTEKFEKLTISSLGFILVYLN